MSYPRRIATGALRFAAPLVLAVFVACGGGDDDAPKSMKAGVLPQPTLPPLTATPAPNTTVVPNGAWVAGANAAVVLGGGSAQGVAARAQKDSGKRALALWLLVDGEWRYAVPSMPNIDGGVRELPDRPLSMMFVLQ